MTGTTGVCQPPVAITTFEAVSTVSLVDTMYSSPALARPSTWMPVRTGSSNLAAYASR